MIIQKHFSYYSSESRKLIHSLPCWKADLKPTMDYKVRLKVKSRSLLCRKLRGVGIAVNAPIAQGWEKGNFCRTEEEMQWCLHGLSTPSFTGLLYPALGQPGMCRAGAGPGVSLPELKCSQLGLHQSQGKQTGWQRVLGLLEGGACCVCNPQTPHRQNPHHSFGNCRHLSCGSFAFKKYLF